ncbi:ATP-binding protein [Pseudorhodoferax sp. Leaf267]|uniref:AAA family ATPase n=1 Tax=Pseudorhodoferax sp. Leaf267 TaxID=1736316 RepID=UPI0006FB64F5|nr:ATP-binding protein [Pseudorhodoferax sp. Leaf267]KQP22749.1 hypothetical protein ASF43_02275 [Pseudorhodoferax sp. Leaf267]
MKLTRLRVEQLRRFRQPLELQGFDAGLNILAGPNEAGKSTLVRAIRAAFFERHKSSMVEDLRPWGEGSSAAPRVEIDFELDGQPHQLVKSFLGKKRCTLRVGTRQLDGTEAEDHLAQLFGFGFAPKGASKPEHWGIPGLLWVEQGTGQELDVRHARDHLHDALQDGVGDQAGALAATGGDALLDDLRAQRSLLLTGTGKPRADYEAAAKAIDQHQAELQTLDTQIAHYRQQVDQLATWRAQHAQEAADRPWDALDLQLQVALAQQQTLKADQQQLATDRARLAELEQTRQLLAQQLAALDRQQADAAARTQALAAADAQRATASAAVAAAQQQADAAQARAQVARTQCREARQQAARAGLIEQVEAARADAERQAQALARADDAQARCSALRARIAAQPAITEPQLLQLRKLERTLGDAALRRQAVATRLAYQLPGGQRIGLTSRGAEHALQGQGEQLLDAPATLHLEGGGQLHITPGGQDLAKLAAAHQQAQDALQHALAALVLADLAEAETRLAACNALKADLQLAEQALAIVAPHGIDHLRAAVDTARSRAQAAQDAVSRLPLAADARPLPLPEAEAAQQAADQAEQAALAALATARQHDAAAQSRHDAAQREQQAAHAALADPAHAQRRTQAQQQLLATGAEHQAVDARAAQASAALQSARPDIVAQDIARLQRSVDALQRAHRQRHEDILVLQTSLQQAGAQGLEEERAAVAGQHARAQRRCEELRRRAAALDLLCRKLEARRQATLARLQAPLQQRLQHYLPLLLPGATVQMDAQLAPGLLTRPATSGATESGQVADLSFGAREQLGLISRFAYADLLQQAGRPTLLILDDALVHSDSARLAQMKRVLFDAAQRHQVLLFTCHPESWRDMGVAVRALQEGN